MRKLSSAIALLLLIATYGLSGVHITPVSSGCMEIELTVADAELSIIKETGSSFSRLSLEGFESIGEPGTPQLPAKTFSFMTAKNSELRYEIISSETENSENISVAPAPMPYAPEVGTTPVLTTKPSGEIYNTNSSIPESPVAVTPSGIFRGVPIQHLTLSPVQHNPVQKEITIYRLLKLRVYFDPFTGFDQLAPSGQTLIRNSVVNAPATSRLTRAAGGSSASDHVLLLTTNEFRPAVEKLSRWHQMKGFETSIIAKSSWMISEVTDSVTKYYNNSTVKPGYLLIVGDYEDVPSTPQTAKDSRSYVSDHPYVCIEGTDNFGEMSRGRISPSSVIELEGIIAKIIAYEQNPPAKSSFYSNALASSYFQDTNRDGVEDMGFVEHIEEVRTHLSSSYSISSDREYYADSDVIPTSYETSLDPGTAVPSDLQRGNYSWDSDKYSLADNINEGRFLIYHYDHGMSYGWVDPAFTTSDTGLLTNDSLLPVMISIDCWVGKFDDQSNFSEAILRKEDGGVAGLVAASCYTMTGHNDALLYGLIDAVWPGIHLESQYVNQGLGSHEPIYRMGDVLTQGLFRMKEQWNNPTYYAATNEQHT